jgi:hypothetical protein
LWFIRVYFLVIQCVSTLEFEKYVGEGFTLNKKSAKQQAQQHRESVREMIDDAQDDEGQEDIERWEEDMMKFGGAKQDKGKFDPYARPPNYRPAQGNINTKKERRVHIDISYSASLFFHTHTVRHHEPSQCSIQ